MIDEADRKSAEATASGWPHLPDVAMATLAALAILAALMLNFLRFHSYPLLTPEVAIVAAAVVGAAVLFGVVHRAMPLVGRALMEAGLILFAVMANTDELVVQAICFGIVFVLVLVRERSLLPFAGTMAFVMLVAASLGIGQQKDVAAVQVRAPTAGDGQTASAAPAIVHILLDEHIGIEGLPADNPRTPEIKSKLKGFFLSRGFRLFGRAYSEHFNSASSIPQILNFGATRFVPTDPRRRDWAVGANAHFDRLRRAGYRLNIYQTEYLDFCKGQQVASCATYSSQNFRALADTSLPPSDKAGLLLKKFVPQALWDAIPQSYRPPPIRITPINALIMADFFIADLAKAERGQVYFAHILMPHFPYATTPSCELARISRWMHRRSGAPRAARENAYFDQVECTLKKLDAALRAVAASPAGDDFIMIVHGDHGSRIVDFDPGTYNDGRIDDQLLLAGFSTLFAIRAPHMAAQYDRQPVAAGALLFEALRPGGMRVRANTTPSVFLNDTSHTPRLRMALPRSWRAMRRE